MPSLRDRFTSHASNSQSLFLVLDKLDEVRLQLSRDTFGESGGRLGVSW